MKAWLAFVLGFVLMAIAACKETGEAKSPQGQGSASASAASPTATGTATATAAPTLSVQQLNAANAQVGAMSASSLTVGVLTAQTIVTPSPIPPTTSTTHASTPMPGCTSNSPCTLTITMQLMPPTRTYCVAEEAPTDKRSTSKLTPVVFEWDPLRPRSLSRSATIDIGQVSIRCWSEPARHAIEADANFGWSFSQQAGQDLKFHCNKDQACLTWCKKSASPPGSSPSPPPPSAKSGASSAAPLPGASSNPKQDPSESPPIPVECELATADNKPRKFTVTDIRPFDAPLGAGTRSFLPNEEAAAELLQTVAEVLLERAESKGVALLGGKLAELVCGLKSDPASDAQIKCKNAEKPCNSRRLLPRTCEVLSATKLQDLAAGGRLLVSTLAQDFLDEVVPWCALTENPEPLKQLAGLGVRALAGERLSTDSELRRIVLLLLDNLREKETGDVVKIGGVGGQKLYDTIAECNSYGRCDEARIQSLLGGAPQTKAMQVVTSMLQALGPWEGDANLLQRIQALARVAVLVACGEGGGVVDRERALTALMDAATAQDLGAIVTAAIGLYKLVHIDDKSHIATRMQKLAVFATAIGAHFNATNADKPEDKAARREARKNAVNAMIDAMTSWDERRGDLVVSLGVSAGWMVGGAIATTKQQFSLAQTQPTVGLGLGFTYLTNFGWAPGELAFHLQLMPFDVGAYARIREDQKADDRELAPEDIVRPTVSTGIGYLPPGWDQPILLLTSVGYSITSDERGERRPLFIGQTLEVYWSMFDFN